MFFRSGIIYARLISLCIRTYNRKAELPTNILYMIYFELNGKLK